MAKFDDDQAFFEFVLAIATEEQRGTLFALVAKDYAREVAFGEHDGSSIQEHPHQKMWRIRFELHLATIGDKKEGG